MAILSQSAQGASGTSVANTDFMRQAEAEYAARGQTMTPEDRTYWASNPDMNALRGAFANDRATKMPDPTKLTEEAYMGAINDKQGSLGQQWLDFSKNQWEVSTTRQSELDSLYKSMSADQQQLAREHLDYTSKITGQQMDMARSQLALTNQVAAKQMEMADYQFGIAKEDRDRYNTKFKPIEDEFIKEASTYGSPEALDEAAAKAKADVLTAAAESKEQALRQSAALGISPNSGRFKGIDRAGDLGAAIATAGAQNNARTAVSDKALALKADVVNLGKGLGASSAQAAGLGLSAGNAATSGTTAATGLSLNAGSSAISSMGQSVGLGIDTKSNIIGMGQANQGLFNNSMSIPSSGYAGAMTGYAGQNAGLQNLYSTKVGIQQNKDQNKSNEFGSVMGALGTGLGLFLSDENLKEDKEPIADGEALEAVNSMPVESWSYKEGVADEGSHVGTYAQDFQRATGKGDGHSIPAQDAIGITMKAVQDLSGKVDKLAAAIGLGDQSQRKKPATKPGMTIEGTARRVDDQALAA